MYDELFPDALAADSMDRVAQLPSVLPADQQNGAIRGFLHEAANFKSSAGAALMKVGAETARAVDMAGAAWPVAMDAVTGGSKEQDAYFQTHDEIFNAAVDYWTPKPEDVSEAGQLVGQVFGGGVQLAINPGLMVGAAQLSTAEDMSRQGVDAGTANAVGAIAGISTAVGIKLPMLGKTLASKIGTGVAGNVAQGVATRGAQGAILEAQGYDKQAAQFDPWDAKALLLDAAMGTVFGAFDHKATQAERDALLTMNQARHMERDTAPGLPVDQVDLQKHTDALTLAVEQVLRGEPVNVDAVVEGMRMADDPALQAERTAMAEEITKVVYEETFSAPFPKKALADAVRVQAVRELTTEARAQLTAEAGNLADKGAVAELKQQQRAVRQQLDAITQEPEAAFKSAAKDFQAAGLSRKQAESRARKELADRQADLNARHEAIGQQIETNAKAQQAANELASLERGKLPQRFASLVDDRAGQILGRRTLVESIRDANRQIDVERPPIDTAPAPAEPTAAEGDKPAKPASNDVVKPEVPVDPLLMESQRALAEHPDLAIPTGDVNPDGSAHMVSAAEAIAKADTEAADIQTRAPGLFQSVAHCLLGLL